MLYITINLLQVISMNQGPEIFGIAVHDIFVNLDKTGVDHHPIRGNFLNSAFSLYSPTERSIPRVAIVSLLHAFVYG